MFDFVIECIINFLNNTIALEFKKILIYNIVTLIFFHIIRIQFK